MGGAQGAIGWWMVKSGLDEKLLEEVNSTDHPRVSPYRYFLILLDRNSYVNS